MLSSFIQFLCGIIKLNENEIEVICESVPVKQYQRGKTLLKEGEVSYTSYFIINGCVRNYYISDGEEKTTFFYTENQFVTSMQSFRKQQPADHYLECVEDCTLALLSYEMERRLLKEYPKFEVLSRILLEEELGKYQQMLSAYITSSPEKRYLNLQQTRPDLIDRIPQHHLATYLGVKPESLSRIRKRMSSKQIS